MIFWLDCCYKSRQHKYNSDIRWPNNLFCVRMWFVGTFVRVLFRYPLYRSILSENWETERDWISSLHLIWQFMTCERYAASSWKWFRSWISNLSSCGWQPARFSTVWVKVHFLPINMERTAFWELRTKTKRWDPSFRYSLIPFQSSINTHQFRFLTSFCPLSPTSSSSSSDRFIIILSLFLDSYCMSHTVRVSLSISSFHSFCLNLHSPSAQIPLPFLITSHIQSSFNLSILFCMIIFLFLSCHYSRKSRVTVFRFLSPLLFLTSNVCHLLPHIPSFR